MTRFEIYPTPLEGLMVIQRKCIGDNRGHFARLFCAEEMRIGGWAGPVAQVNHSFSSLCATVRGMHFQYPPHAEMKLVSCLEGEIFDVAVDIRRGSPTFLRWHAERLSAGNRRAMLIPAGFAHGYQTLTTNCALLYVHSAEYAPDSEGALRPTDPRLQIDWPLRIGELSARDRGHQLLDATFEGIVL
jgi:dTDP-4-dehydrorhamnose 3,5-epimerase